MNTDCRPQWLKFIILDSEEVAGFRIVVNFRSVLAVSGFLMSLWFLGMMAKDYRAPRLKFVTLDSDERA